MAMAAGKSTPLACIAACLCLLLGACSNGTGDSSAADTGGQTAAHTPGWVAGCFKSPVHESSSDRDYVGLTKPQAEALARQRGQQLLLVGAGGQCMKVGDQVRYASPVAVVFASGSLKSGVPDNAEVVYSTSTPTAMNTGWRLG